MTTILNSVANEYTKQKTNKKRNNGKNGASNDDCGGLRWKFLLVKLRADTSKSFHRYCLSTAEIYQWPFRKIIDATLSDITII